MKTSLLALSVATTVVAGTSCPGASVYMFTGDNGAAKEASTKENNSPVTLNLHQAQLVLADFVGVSQLYSSSGANFPSNFKHKCHGKGMFGASSDEDLNGKAPTAVVVVNGLPEGDNTLFFANGNGQENLEDILTPSFKIDEAPSSSFFRAFFDKISTDVSDIYSGEVKSTFDKAVSVISHFVSDLENAAIAGLEESGFFKRSLRNMDDGEMASHHRHMDDVDHIRRLGSELNRGQTAFVRVESLGMLHKDNSPEYKKALSDISVALKDLVSLGSDLRLLVIAAPYDACTDKARSMIKRAASEGTSPLSRRSSALSSSLGPYSSAEICENVTDSCSGHGACHKLANGLYACSCKKTYDADKKKTTYWGGNACQKKDVSVETQMFLWTAIGILFAIYAGVKLMFSIGSDPLPGILNVAKRSSSST